MGRIPFYAMAIPSAALAVVHAVLLVPYAMSWNFDHMPAIPLAHIVLTGLVIAGYAEMKCTREPRRGKNLILLSVAWCALGWAWVFYMAEHHPMWLVPRF